MQAEIERRAINSGVPRELYVYEMVAHYSDEGGPRCFVPLKEMQDLKGKKRDRSLWPALIRSALQDGVPIELALDDSRMYRDGRIPPADLCQWGYTDDHLLILNERANAALEPFLRQTCRAVPVTCAIAKLFAYHLVAVDDVLDLSQPNSNWHGPRYSIQTEKLGRWPIFRTPQDQHQILLLQPVVDVIQEHQLTGFRFRRVWPHSSIPPQVAIEVKKRPRSVVGRQRDPKLSTTANKIQADFLQKLLGSPLTNDRGAPFELAAYRLPDLSLPSGSVIAADLLLSEEKPFARRIKPGDYPLTLIAARFRGNDERIAFAMLHFCDRPVAMWEVAATEETAGKKSPESHQHGYGVDSGTGGFGDAGAQEALLNLADPQRTWMKRVEKEMARAYRPTRSWVHVQTGAGSAAIFSSGYGDGQYQSYFGLDAAGEPVVLMTDFEILDWPSRPQLV